MQYKYHFMFEKRSNSLYEYMTRKISSNDQQLNTVHRLVQKKSTWKMYTTRYEWVKKENAAL